jgi:hypothetical protein
VADLSCFNCGSVQHSDDQTCVGLIVLHLIVSYYKTNDRNFVPVLQVRSIFLYDLRFFYKVLPQLSSATQRWLDSCLLSVTGSMSSKMLSKGFTVLK